MNFYTIIQKQITKYVKHKIASSLKVIINDYFKAESTYLGDHTVAVKRGLMQGFLIFVVSEILIFSLLIQYLNIYFLLLVY